MAGLGWKRLTRTITFGGVRGSLVGEAQTLPSQPWPVPSLSTPRVRPGLGLPADVPCSFPFLRGQPTRYLRCLPWGLLSGKKRRRNWILGPLRS